MTDYLCPEGQRLWDEWDKLRMQHNIYDCSMRPTDDFIQLVNNLWTGYLDHRAACPEYTKIIYKTVGGHDDESI